MPLLNYIEEKTSQKSFLIATYHYNAAENMRKINLDVLF